MNTGVLLTLIVIGGVVCCEVLSCNSCGNECQSSCGTRQFRACCYNYLRKRTSGNAIKMDPSLRLELWLAHSHGLHNSASNDRYGNQDLTKFENKKEEADIVDEFM